MEQHSETMEQHPETMETWNMSRVHGPILAIELWTLEWTLWNILSTTNDSECLIFELKFI